MKLTMSGFRWDRELQIIQADTVLELEGEAVIDEALCVDVGMPALVCSVSEDVKPDRWSPPEEWRKKPFWVCGCGDPECRAYSFMVQHKHKGGTGEVLLTEIDEREDGTYRVQGEILVPAEEYRAAVLAAAESFLVFAGELKGYSPLFDGTLEEVRRQIRRARGEGV